jgi:hypothetical protein
MKNPMGLLGNIFGRKEKKSLEQLVREVIRANGITIDPSFNDLRNYYSFNVIGTGSSEKDSDGALRHFEHNLVHGINGLPEVVSEIKEDLAPRDLYGRKKRVYAVGYKKNSPAAA